MSTTAASPSIFDRVGHLARDIKLSHSVFALPFAVLGMFLAAASVDALPTIGQVVLILVCMFLARTVAMLANRWADRRIDADNPRTEKRAIPAGRVSPGFALTSLGTCALLFMVATSGFWWLDGNAWPMMLSTAAVFGGRPLLTDRAGGLFARRAIRSTAAAAGCRPCPW